MRTYASILVLVASAAVLAAAPPPPAFVVHEWGTFTTRVDASGVEIEFDRVPERFELPSFVHGRELRRLKGGLRGTVRMETPVLYVRASEPMTIDVDVAFPGGVLTEWYPRADVRAGAPDERPWDRLAWPTLRVDPRSNAILPTTFAGAEYYCARGVDAAVLTAGTDDAAESEKFVFYRGMGTFTPPLLVRREGDDVVAKNRGEHRIDRVMWFERDARGFASAIRCSLEPGEEHVFARGALAFAPDLRLDDLKKILRGQGLREDEAQAMVDTWRSSWFEPGARALYTVPRAVTDAVLPLTITPQPTTLVRALVGRTDLVVEPLASN